jgi:hypothetical protein
MEINRKWLRKRDIPVPPAAQTLSLFLLYERGRTLSWHPSFSFSLNNKAVGFKGCDDEIAHSWLAPQFTMAIFLNLLHTSSHIKNSHSKRSASRDLQTKNLQNKAVLFLLFYEIIPI